MRAACEPRGLRDAALHREAGTEKFLEGQREVVPAGDRGCGFCSSFCCPLQPHTLGFRCLAAPPHSHLWAPSVDTVVICVPAGLAGSPCCIWPRPHGSGRAQSPGIWPTCPLLPDPIPRWFRPPRVHPSAGSFRGPRPTLPSEVDYIPGVAAAQENRGCGGGAGERLGAPWGRTSLATCRRRDKSVTKAVLWLWPIRAAQRRHTSYAPPRRS